MNTADTLRDIAESLSDLTPDWRDQERYFENRDEILHAIHRLADRLERR